MAPSNDDEWEAVEEGKERVKAVKKYFLKPREEIQAQFIPPGPESAEGCKEDVGEKITEDLLHKLREARLALKMAEAQEKQLTNAVKTLAGDERGVIQRGKMICKLTERKGRVTIRWEEWYKAEYGTDPKESMDPEYVKIGEPALVLEIEQLP